jgi:hypothetical protein
MCPLEKKEGPLSGDSFLFCSGRRPWTCMDEDSEAAGCGAQ